MSEIETLPQFLERTGGDNPDAHLATIRSALETRAGDPSTAIEEFSKMKRYIADIYKDVKVARSFHDAGGRVVDCIPFDQQPSVRSARKAGIVVPQEFAPPPNLGWKSPGGERATAGPSPCPEGHVPFMRVGLDTLARWGTLEAYLEKNG